MADKTESLFSLRYAVTVSIAAPPSTVWAKLTDAKGFPSWNSTVTSIEGPIVLGQKLAIRVPVSDRVFSPKVVVLEPEQRMVWRDGFFPMFEGARTFTLTREAAGTRFDMDEHFRGAMLPMIKGSLPDFAPIFDRYAADLKAACER
ncbi:MAG: SRPBCC domain-containing protein [Sandaracinaceae bacterium]|nr:SRPBCC domain-containing protein [Sandaracinaceae bacterium]